MLQIIIIGLLVLIATAYLTRLVYRSFTSSSCTTGCGKCNAADIDAMVASFEKKKAQG